MKVVKIDRINKQLLLTIFQLQIRSYKVEAALIGSDLLPPLKETFEQFQNSKECIYGLFDVEQELKGAIFIEDDSLFVINKLVIEPNSFRKGYAQRLISFVLERFSDRSIKVSTASKNIPARNLYEKNGFTLQSEWKTKEGIQIVNYSFRK